MPKPVRRLLDTVTQPTPTTPAKQPAKPTTTPTTKKVAPTKKAAPKKAAVTTTGEEITTTQEKAGPTTPTTTKSRRKPDADRVRDHATTTARASTATVATRINSDTLDLARRAFWTEKLATGEPYNLEAWVSAAVRTHAALSYEARTAALAACPAETHTGDMINRPWRLNISDKADMETARNNDIAANRSTKSRSRFVIDAIRVATHTITTTHGQLKQIPAEGLPRNR